MKFPEGLSKSRLEALTALHLRRYQRMMDAAKEGKPGFRIVELYELLDVWKSIALNSGSIVESVYSPAAIREICEAYDDAGYDNEVRP